MTTHTHADAGQGPKAAQGKDFEMTQRLHQRAAWRVGRPLAIAALLAAGPALAQGEAIATAPAAQPAAASPPDTGASPAATPPSQIMVVNLIRLLVKQGVITQDAADALVQEAEAEAREAKVVASAAPPALPPAPADVVRVPYIPQVVRDAIKEDIKRDVIAQAKQEAWASPGSFPDWVSHIQWFGDIRFRDAYSLYSHNNVSPYIDYATLNATGPIDVNQTTNPNGLPLLNTQTNRLNQLSVRARFGMNVNIFDGVSATVRLATGSDSSPVSTTQLLGADSGKKNIWLDQAYLTLTPNYWSKVNLGRMPDQFIHTDLVFDDNLNFDGIDAVIDRPLGDQGLKVFGVAGVFPLEYISDSFPANGAQKTGDETKWLYAIQAGASFQPDPLSWSVRGAVSFYDFENVAGQLSAPCYTYEFIKQCSTDWSRPAFMQKGNTLFLLRNIQSNPALANGYTAEPEYVGLAYNYRELDVTAEAEIPMFGATRGQLQADFVRNLAYSPASFLASNGGLTVTNYDGGAYRSGPNAFLIKATVGYLHASTKGDWNVVAGYRYIEPDAVLDAFNDHDFHLGGTNAKGYYMQANYYFANNTWLSARWFSATEVYGPKLAIDVLQLELDTRF